MCLNLNDYKFKTSTYNYDSTYFYLMVTTNQKPMIDIHQKKKKGKTKGTIINKRMMEPTKKRCPIPDDIEVATMRW